MTNYNETITFFKQDFIDWCNEWKPPIQYQELEQLKLPTDYKGMVQEFHEKFGHPVADFPAVVTCPAELLQLRYDLIEEELHELGHALNNRDVTETADALADLLYVTFGAALVFGIPIDKVFEEVQRSNMSKLGEDGKPVYREDGKILKGPNYSPPDITPIILAAFPDDEDDIEEQ